MGWMTINVGQSIGPDDVAYLLQSISAAAAYDPSATYSEGDYCTYQGQLYKANQDISAAEPWTAAHWTATSIMAEVGAHVEDKNNPHGVTAAQVGAIPESEKGQPGGVATLGADGKVPPSQVGPAGGSLLTIMFDETFEGLPYTLAGGEESYSGTVPESLEAVHSLLAVNTTYTLTVTDGDETYTAQVQTDEWFTALELSIAPFRATITVTCPAGSTVTCANGDTTLTQTATGGTATFTVGNAGTWTVTATLGGESASGQVEITASGESKSIELVYVHIYGVQWDGTSTTKWSRTDDAELFSDPNPAVNNGSGSSPFDSLLPWSGMVIEEDATAGKLVKIPKYWYKWTRSGNTMKLQIADKETEGFHTSPAHADRGDGKGERDYVYVGRYHCGNQGNRPASIPNIYAINNVTRSEARSMCRDSGCYQYDFAMYWTIMMLYLVEFADWNSQNVIGYGCSQNGNTQPNGVTDSMQYHTGTSAANRTTYGICQYRHIEGLWDNVFDWCDGIYFNGTNVYCINNPENFSDSSGGTLVGTRGTGGWISSFTNPTAEGFEWALYPVGTAGSESTYVCDYCYYSANGVVLRVGGYYYQGQHCGAFSFLGNFAASVQDSYIGFRLQKLP